jgi:DNA-binding LytR/AlgR family response regulator
LNLNLENSDEDNIEIDSVNKTVVIRDDESVEKDNNFIERIALKTGQKIHVILIPDLVYIQSDGDYVQLITENGKYIKEETMKYFEANLHPHKFVRIHRSYIVNVEKIARIELFEKNSQILILKNGHQIKASTTGYKMLREILNL